jgi:hypothetical protein
MEPAELAEWLKTAESRAMGWSEEEGNLGDVGERILELAKMDDATKLTDQDLDFMEKVVDCIYKSEHQRL